MESLQEEQQRQTSCVCKEGRKEGAFETGPQGKESGGERGEETPSSARTLAYMSCFRQTSGFFASPRLGLVGSWARSKAAPPSYDSACNGSWMRACVMSVLPMTPLEGFVPREGRRAAR